MYYRLREDPMARQRGVNVAVIATQPSLPFAWRTGTRFTSAVPTLVRCTLAPRGGPDLPDAFFSKRIPLFSLRLVETLRRAGVDNLDCYDAEIWSADGASLVARYYATNIVGAISCADRAQSRYDAESEVPMLEFEHVALDEPKIGTARMFRLGENLSFILVAEEVKRALDETAWVGVRAVPLDDPAAY
jgi:hypothetical protein